LESSFVNSPRGEFNRLNHWLQARARLHGALTFRTRRTDHRSPSRCRRSSMAPRRGTTRRRFLQSTALAAAGLALPRTGFAASPDLKLKKPINTVLLVTNGATEKYNEDLVFKRHVRQCFRVCVPVYQDGIASALVAKDLPVKRWATISPDYEYGHTSWKMFRAYLKRFKPDV